jgi:hypothetical protein
VVAAPPFPVPLTFTVFLFLDTFAEVNAALLPCLMDAEKLGGKEGELWLLVLFAAAVRGSRPKFPLPTITKVSHK